jgi:predicted deacylase
LLGRIIDPTSGTILEELTSPCDGLLFTLREYPVVNPGSLIARVLEVEMPQDKESTHD